jgi:hypothetical protein
MILQGIIAVESTLSNICIALETEGYEVVKLEVEEVDDVDAIVVSGLDSNFLNMQETVTEVPVINAAGKTTQEVLEELEKL